MSRGWFAVTGVQSLLPAVAGIAACVAACTTHLPAEPVAGETPGTVVIGRAVAVITGDRSRMYEPAVRFMELINRETRERYNVEIESDDRRFVLPLPPGHYELNRVQISEGPFMSMAHISAVFSIGRVPVTYLGTWRFGVDSPRYGRMITVSMVTDEEDRRQSIESVREQFPSLENETVATVLPAPEELEARLYEVMPYPRYPRYFRRHLW